MIAVLHLQRRPLPGQFSIERLFDDVRAALPGDIRVTLHLNQRASHGLVPRLADAWAARRAPGALKHILGDVHYLAWFLPRRGTLLTFLDCVLLESLTGIRRAAIWFLWYWWPLRRIGRITVISEYTREALLKWV